MNFTSEKRCAPRSPCNEKVTFRVSALPGGPVPLVQSMTGTVVDISATGMGVATMEMLHKGQLIVFDRDQPNWQLPTQGLIVWTCQSHQGYRAGIEFIL